MTLDVADAQGKLIVHLKPTLHTGMNRVWWNLRYEKTIAVALRTTPPGNPHIWSEKRFAGKETRPVFYYGVGGQATAGPQCWNVHSHVNGR